MRTRNKSADVQFQFSGMPRTMSGSLNMSIVSIGSAFERHSSADGYQSAAFSRFVGNLDVVHSRVKSIYKDVSTGSEISKYSPAVMIPAFLSAYTGRSAARTSLDIFPGVLSMMPNWRISYTGLSRLPFFRRHFKSVTLNHAYRSTYSIGSYSTYQSFQSYMGDMGFVTDATTGELTPSSLYDISAVSINEQFSPLIGVELSLKNGITTKAEYRLTRVLNLSMTSCQVVESSSRDFVLGTGYKIVGLQLFPGRNTSHSAGRISNDLTLRLDLSLRRQDALCRDIQSLLTQATSGTRAVKWSFSADYALSRLLSLRLYYDRQKNTPLVSSTSYPVISSDIGLTMKFSLNR
jgi:cell surface protein SprA